jgi:hypothetical protein
MGLGRGMGVTTLMGLQGEGAPRTAQEAEQMYDQLVQKRQEISDPNYLQNQARQRAVTMLQDADKQHSGILTAMFKDRANGGSKYNTYVRQPMIEAALRQNPELEAYLTKNPNGTFSLPAGNSFEELAGGMLTNAYGEYPTPQKEGAYAVKLSKLIEKWAFNDMDAKELSDLKAEKAVPCGRRPERERASHARKG